MNAVRRAGPQAGVPESELVPARVTRTGTSVPAGASASEAAAPAGALLPVRVTRAGTSSLSGALE